MSRFSPDYLSMIRTPWEGTEPKLRKDAVRTRGAILDAAHDLLQQDPEASHAAIAEAAGVGRASVATATFPSARTSSPRCSTTWSVGWKSLPPRSRSHRRWST